MKWPDARDTDAWRALADVDSHEMQERIAIKAEAGVSGDLEEQARDELRETYRRVKARSEVLGG
jgi:hypothetical protein